MTASPTVSVAMCTWNGARFLEAQLASITQQKRLPDELIICDDHSSDNTVDILRAFAATASFPVKIVVNPQNLGYAANFAQAIGLCTGELIALSDQDDIWYPNRLDRSAQEFDHSPKAVLVFSDADLMDERNRPLQKTLWRRVGFSNRRKQDLLKGRFIVLAKYRFVTGATVMFRASLRQYILSIPAGWIHDEWIVLIAAAFGEIRPVDEPLIRYRIHETQQVGFRNKLKQRTRGMHWARLSESQRELQEMSDALVALGEKNELVMKAYSQHLEFLRFRANLPVSRVLRLLPVLQHLHGYSIHASGWKSAIRDLATPRSRS